jgi:hypothetical protein
MPDALLHLDDLDAEIVEGVTSRRTSCEREARESGFPLPLQHTSAWAAAQRKTDSLLVVLRDDAGACRGAFALERGRSRALPQHFVLRAERVGGSIAPDARIATAQTVAFLARSQPRVLFAAVELLSRDADARTSLALALADAGFRPHPAPRSYRHTLVLDLTPDADALFARLSRNTRRDIRTPGKRGLVVRPISDVALAPRLDALMRETMARTGGRYQPHDWRTMLAFSAGHPERLRIVGVFRDSDSSPDALVAFACGRGHGDHAEYHLGASTRAADLKVPLAYAPLWDLILWARQFGASWFDLGGVTDASLGDGDPLAGISDFKRYFAKDVVHVGEEWVFEPRPARAGLARVVSAGAAWLTHARSR